ncbi:MAG TPA: septum formation initiator family protein [Chloroflexia bacterium]|nr:septum formation initiator family protein [Chloroflexia bacterium]
MAQPFKWAKSFINRISSKLMIAVVIIFLMTFLGLFLWQSLQIREKQAEFQKEQAEVATMVARNDDLQNHLDFYKGPGYLLYVEKVAREALGMSKPGETVILPVPDKSTNSAESKPAATDIPTANDTSHAIIPAQQKPNWQSWLDLFTGQ